MVTTTLFCPVDASTAYSDACILVYIEASSTKAVLYKNALPHVDSISNAVPCDNKDYK